MAHEHHTDPRNTVATRNNAVPSPSHVHVPAVRGGGFVTWIDRHLPVVFNVPTVALLSGLVGLPVILVLWTSLTDWRLISAEASRYVGLRNYTNVWTDERWVNAIWHTFYFAIASVALQLVLGFAAAFLLNRQVAGKTVYRSVFMLPMIAMPTAISLVWIIFFDNTYGLFNYWLKQMGLGPIGWTSNPRWVIPSLVLVSVWQHTPFMALLILAGLQSLPADPFEAARIDGASKWQTFVNITLPLLRGHIAVALILRSIFALKEFDIIAVITYGGPNWGSETMNMNIYFSAFEYGYMGMASAKGVLFFCFILAMQLVLIRLRRREWSY
ncbi:MAG: sugar ABC transporter permease [Candidatus Rokubacteria bacterium]|nr:sugar ABC transporter permease [Candidatus Rokubacteria bacterium]